MSRLSVSSSKSKLPSTSSGGYVDAERPFDASAKADVILRSADSVDFFVLKTILSLTSPVFDDMFSNARVDAKTRNGLPVVDLAEDSVTLNNLLLLVYPYAKGPTNTLEMYMKVGMAAKKYAIDEALGRLEKLVGTSEAIVNQPLGFFAIAVHFGWVGVMRDAAWDTLAVPLCDLVGGDELQMLTGTDFVGLLQWRFACQGAIDKLLLAKRELYRSSSSQRAFADNIRPRLKEIGCPQGAVLVTDSIIARVLGSIAEPSPTSSTFGKVLETAKILTKEIDNEVSKVPLMIRNQWVVAPKPVTPEPVLPEPVILSKPSTPEPVVPSESVMPKLITPEPAPVSKPVMPELNKPEEGHKKRSSRIVF